MLPIISGLIIGYDVLSYFENKKKLSAAPILDLEEPIMHQQSLNRCKIYNRIEVKYIE